MEQVKQGLIGDEVNKLKREAAKEKEKSANMIRELERQIEECLRNEGQMSLEIQRLSKAVLEKSNEAEQAKTKLANSEKAMTTKVEEAKLEAEIEHRNEIVRVLNDIKQTRTL
jgi:hypothetical protein